MSVDDAADGYLQVHTLTHLPRHGPGKRVGGWAGMWEIGKEQQWRGDEEPHLPTCTPSYSGLRQEWVQVGGWGADPVKTEKILDPCRPRFIQWSATLFNGVCPLYKWRADFLQTGSIQ